MRAFHLLRQQGHVGALRLALRADGWERLEARAPAEGEPQAADLPRRGPTSGGRGALRLGERPACPVEQGTAGFRQLDLMAGPWNSSAASSCSSCRMATLSGGCAICKRRAARLKFNSSATATVARRWRAPALPKTLAARPYAIRLRDE